MNYILFIAFPLVMSVSCFLLRKQTLLVLGAALLALLAQLALALQLPTDAPARLFGLTLTLAPLGRLFLLGFYLVAGLAMVASWYLPHGENFVPVTLLLLGFTGATLLLLQEPFVVALLLVSASISAVLAIVDLPTGSPALVGRAALRTGLKYLVLTVIAGVMMYLAYVLISIYQPETTTGRASPAHLILGLLAVGFGLRLAVVPFHSWLPDLAADAAPMVSVVVMAITNGASLLFLISSLQFFPVVVAENERGLQIMQGLGIATALLGAVQALAQPNLRRAIGYLVIYDAGMTLFGLMTVTELGLAGAIFQAFNQMLTVLLLFVALGTLELPDGRPPHVVRRDLLRRWPVAGVALLAGGLALLGIPPLNGFAGKLLIYQAAAQRGWPFLGLLLLATLLALLALLRLARDRLFGAAEDLPLNEQPLLLGMTELDRPAERQLVPEPRGIAALLCGLLALCLAIGLYPQPLLELINQLIDGLTFVKTL